MVRFFILCVLFVCSSTAVAGNTLSGIKSALTPRIPIHFIYIGPPKGEGDPLAPDRTDTKGPLEISNKLDTRYEVNFWVLNSQVGAFERNFSRHPAAFSSVAAPVLKVRSIEEELAKADSKNAIISLAARNLTSISALISRNTSPPIVISDRIVLKDFFSLYLLATQGGFIIDTNVYPLKSFSSASLPVLDSFRVIGLRNEEKKLTSTPGAAKSDDALFFKSLGAIWTTVPSQPQPLLLPGPFMLNTLLEQGIFSFESGRHAEGTTYRFENFDVWMMASPKPTIMYDSTALRALNLYTTYYPNLMRLRRKPGTIYALYVEAHSSLIIFSILNALFPNEKELTLGAKTKIGQLLIPKKHVFSDFPEQQTSDSATYNLEKFRLSKVYGGSYKLTGGADAVLLPALPAE